MQNELPVFNKCIRHSDTPEDMKYQNTDALNPNYTFYKVEIDKDLMNRKWPCCTFTINFISPTGIQDYSVRPGASCIGK
jgi:hypothetical protein